MAKRLEFYHCKSTYSCENLKNFTIAEAYIPEKTFTNLPLQENIFVDLF